MSSPRLILVLLFAIGVSCASILEPWFQTWGGGRNKSANALDMLIGDSRRMFANHFFAKADAYFHSGYYPTIFDSQKREEESHMAGAEEESDHEGHEHDENCDHEEKSEGGFLGPPKDWIDCFSRNFFPSQHSHLEKGGERELLPWLRISAELDPQRVETYIIASYWLRSRMDKVDEAEQFLREGLRANPDSYEIYYELGRIRDENRHDPLAARNLWEIALRKWNAQQLRAETDENSPKPNVLIFEGITGRLAKLEERQGNFKKAIEYWKLLKEKSPAPEEIEKRIQEVQEQIKREGANQ